MITLKNVTKIYGKSSEVIALRDITMEIKESEFLAVMGPSGSGKSTLLYTIGALLTPTNGEVIIDDVSVYGLNARERARLRREKIGFIFQTFELIPYLTAFENVMVPLYLSNVALSEHAERAMNALNLVGLAHRASHRPSELSGGEQQRVAIARGMVNNPRILLADEPTGNMDRKTGNEILRLIQGLNEKEGITIVMVTHDPSNAQRADRLITLVDGQVKKTEEVKEDG